MLAPSALASDDDLPVIRERQARRFAAACREAGLTSMQEACLYWDARGESAVQIAVRMLGAVAPPTSGVSPRDWCRYKHAVNERRLRVEAALAQAHERLRECFPELDRAGEGWKSLVLTMFRNRCDWQDATDPICKTEAYHDSFPTPNGRATVTTLALDGLDGQQRMRRFVRELGDPERHRLDHAHLDQAV